MTDESDAPDTSEMALAERKNLQPLSPAATRAANPGRLVRWAIDDYSKALGVFAAIGMAAAALLAFVLATKGSIELAALPWTLLLALIAAFLGLGRVVG